MLSKFKAVFAKLLAGGIGLITFSQIALAETGCSLNGKEVDCGEIFNSPFFGLFMGLMGLMVVIGIVCSVLWLWMLIDAIVNPIENKTVWILVIFFLGPLAALVYYILVKRVRSKLGGVQAPMMADSQNKNGEQHGLLK